MGSDELSWDSDHLGSLERCAKQCGLALGVALDDVADSMDEASEAVAKIDADKSGEGSWGAMAGAWSRWWSIFLRQYGGKCFSRWRDKCGNWKDYEQMERLWSESFVPLQMAGCDIAKQVRLRQVKQAVFDLSTGSQASDTESRALLQWAKHLDNPLSKLIASHTELQKQNITRSLKDLAESEKPSGLGKIKRLISGKGQ